MASAMAARQSWAREDRSLQIRQQLESVWAAANEVDATANLYVANILPLAQQNLAASRADWTSGAGDFQAVIEAEEDLLDAKLALEKAQADAWIYRAQLNQLSGATWQSTLFGESQHEQ